MDTKKTPKYVTIIKYLNYQKIKINNQLLHTINKVAENRYEEHSLTKKQLKQTQDLLDIFYNIPLYTHDNTHLYYIFILLNLPLFMVKNICRFFQAKIYEKYQIYTKYNYFEVIKSNNPLDILIENLKEVKKIDNEYILYFVDTLNLFFT